MLSLTIPEFEQVSVFGFQRISDADVFQIRSLQNRDQHSLVDLGVTNASVFMANCSLWVEGITDRMYLRSYLAAYQKSDEFKTAGLESYEEDSHYAYFEYAGSNLAHYGFESEEAELVERIKASALANRIFLLADQDADDRKAKRHEELSTLNGDFFQFRTTVCIEIENLVSATLLREVLPGMIRKRIDPSLLKIEESDYHSVRMGRYLKNVLGDAFAESNLEESGTLSTSFKARMATAVCKVVTWEKMHPEAQKITKDLYQFIRQQNQLRS